MKLNDKKMKKLFFSIVLLLALCLPMTGWGQKDLDPVLTVTPAITNLNGYAHNGTLTLTAENFSLDYVEYSEIEFFEKVGNEYQTTTQPDWLTLNFSSDYTTLNYSVSENLSVSGARSTYFKITLYVTTIMDVTSHMITINQNLLAPSTLPFEFYGGRDDIESIDGMSQNGLGDDFENGPKLNFDSEGDYLILIVNGRTPSLSYDIKGNNFNGTFKVQYSYWGDEWTDLVSYTELGDTKTVTHVDVAEYPFSDARYFKWVFDTRNNGSVALGNIHATPHHYFDIYGDLTLEDLHVDSDHWTVRKGATLTITGEVTFGLYNPTVNDFIIDDGGQLKTHSDVHGTVKKDISAWTNGSPVGGWHFITSPLMFSIQPRYVLNMLADLHSEYDLFRLNNTTWENFLSHDDFTELYNGVGYLYAINAETTLGFQGALKEYSGNDDVVNLNPGWNLVGNKFACNVYANRSYYMMNADGTDIEPVSLYATTVIPVCNSVLVNAASSDETITFRATSSAKSTENNGSLTMTLTRPDLLSDAVQDKAIVSFDKGVELEKFVFNEDHAKLYIPQDGNDYAIAYSDGTGEIPVHFKATETGTYTIEFDGDDMNGVKFIDKFENVTINLGKDARPSVSAYTFTASSADRYDRFVLVFGNVNNASENDIFAYQNGNDIIVEGEGELQVFDVMGRLVSKQYIDGVGTHSVCPLPTGVYIFKLNGKTQKIVVK